MATMTQTQQHSFEKLELRTAYGPVYRDVSTAPAREANADEIPIIDISPIYGDLEARKGLAEQFKHAATSTGFFYIKNHGISEDTIKNAKAAALTFFDQPQDKKALVSKHLSKYHAGYSAKQTALVSVSEGLDWRESFMWFYDPANDPLKKDLDATPPDVQAGLKCESRVWEGTAHLEGYHQACINYWQECLKLARRMVRIFALCLDLPEDYFDSVTTYPGADGVFNFYPAMTPEQASSSQDIGIGSHTDLQCFTLLWQDQNGGLQVLNNEGQWIKASPVAGTFVVNIADFLQRLSNDRFKSTVHRVYNRSTVDRLSMPFFFGFNFNEKCGVLPSCTSAENPAKYEPISCGEWCQLRFAMSDQIDKKGSY